MTASALTCPFTANCPAGIAMKISMRKNSIRPRPMLIKLYLLASHYRPDWPETWVMLNKNHPLTAFLFDLSGMMVIIGIVGMMMRRVQKGSDQKLSGFPSADWTAYALLGSIIITACQQCVRIMNTHVRRNKLSLEVLDIVPLVQKALSN